MLKIVFPKSMLHVKRSELILGKPLACGSARLGHTPSLPWESQLPLKPWLLLQPSDFKGNCDSFDFLLDFYCISFESLICFANVGCSPTPRQHFWKTAAPKNFQLPVACCLETMFLGKPIFHIRQKGVPPLLLPTSVQQLPRCLVRICNLFHKDNQLWIGKFQRMQLQQGELVAK